MIRVAFLIRTLNLGGAERQLVTLATRLDREKFAPVVYCFYGPGKLEPELQAADVPVVCLGKGGRWENIGFFLRLVRHLRAERVQVLVGYLPVSNILAASARLFVPGLRAIFSVRSSAWDLSSYDWVWRGSFWLEARLSRFADYVIVNSLAGRDSLLDRGVAGQRIMHIPNGIDDARYYPDAAAGTAMRQAWGIPTGARVVGLVGRFAPKKDHATFIQAAALMLQREAGGANLHFVCVGDGSAEYRKKLKDQIAALGLKDHFHLPGSYTELRGVYNALDAACLSSYDSEGFPNVVGEAMACGVACAVTDVGDSAYVVGGLGRVVPRSNPDALAEALLALLALPQAERETLGAQVRQRIVEHFSVAQMVARTAAIFEAAAGGSPRVE